MPASTRVRQFVRARIIWSTESAVTAPVTAVTRISGQYFAFVAEADRNRTTENLRPG
jgi:hypothetical protein